MRNIVLVHKIEAPKIVECYVDIDNIVAIENPINNDFKIFFDNAIWVVDSNDFDSIMSTWAPYYKNLVKENNKHD